MNVKTEKDAAGKALYLEFRKNDYTYQMIIMPETIELSGDTVHSAMTMSRRTSSWHPRRNWGFTSGRTTLTRDPDGRFSQLSFDDAEVKVARIYDSLGLSTTFDSLFHKGWTLFGMLAVEFSYKDIETAKTAKTPNDLIRRILRSREASGWGESLHNAVAAPATSPAVPAV
jgi:hypothetical protein